MLRTSFDEYLISLAETASLRSQDIFTRVGSVAATQDNRVISTNYNGLVSGFEPPPDLFENRENPLRKLIFIHSEVNTLLSCPRGSIFTLALTISPCSECAKLIAGHGVKRVIYRTEYWREKENFKTIFDFYNIEYKLIPFKGKFNE